MLGGFGADAVERFVVFGDGFATDGEGDLGGSHEVAFVSGVDEHRGVDLHVLLQVFGAPGRIGRIGGDVLEHDPTDAAAFLVGLGQAVFQEDFDTGLGDPGLEDLFGDVGLEGPLFVFAVVFTDLAVEVAADAADRGFVAAVGETQAAGGHPAQVTAGFDEDDRALKCARGDGGNDTRGGSAVDAEIGDHGSHSDAPRRGPLNEERSLIQKVEVVLVVDVGVVVEVDIILVDHCPAGIGREDEDVAGFEGAFIEVVAGGEVADDEGAGVVGFEFEFGIGALGNEAEAVGGVGGGGTGVVI